MADIEALRQEAESLRKKIRVSVARCWFISFIVGQSV